MAVEWSTSGTPVFQTIANHLEPFVELAPLCRRLLAVLRALPKAVQMDLLEDPKFRIALDDFVPGKGRTVWLATPEPAGNGSRCVVLKPKLAHCPEGFACYVIAHELAHAFLRNGGWGDVMDPEVAADTLASSWGFPRPRSDAA